MKNLQKICDIYDFFDPELLEIITQELRRPPSLLRRLWEFGAIFAALRRAGKLDGDSIGLGLGVGTEQLIFAIAPHVKRAIITDLYERDSRWVSVRTDNPTDLLKELAPWPVDWERMDVRRMDMRRIELPDNSVDFAWSTGAMEHIGADEDFVQHFKEVRRVLKPGGVYAFTTAVAFGEETVRFPHNYLFHPRHLVDLIEESGLHGEPEFDCGLGVHSLNVPAIEDPTEFGYFLPRLSHPHLLSFRRGIVTTANCMVLHTGEGPPNKIAVVGFEETRARLATEAATLVRGAWARWQTVRLDGDAAPCKTPMFYFGGGKASFRVRRFAGSKGRVKVTVVGRAVAFPLNRKVEKVAALTGDALEIEFDADPTRIYRLQAETEADTIEVSAMMAGDPSAAVFDEGESDEHSDLVAVV